MSYIKISKSNLISLLEEFNVYKPCEYEKKDSNCDESIECSHCLYNDLKNRNIIEEL
jgi:hypothetical protein